MLGFTPLASAPLADSGVKNYEIVLSDITTTPVVDSLTIAENEQFILSGITSGVPVVDQLNLSVTSNLAFNDITTGIPVVDSLAAQITVAVTLSDITTGAPTIDTLTTSFTDVLSFNSLGPEVTNYTVTVADNSGNKFYIDGASNPTLSLVRGQKYVFDVSDATNDGHPLRFKDGSGNSYTTGVTASGTAGQSGATVTILVAYDAPSSLRYYCTVHGNGMGNTISVSTQAIGLQPVVDTLNVTQEIVFALGDITCGAPVVDTLGFIQVHNFTFQDIITGAPTGAMRFFWDVQEGQLDSWTNQPDDDSVWSNQPSGSKTWTEAASPSDTWTEVSDPSDTWSKAA